MKRILIYFLLLTSIFSFTASSCNKDTAPDSMQFSLSVNSGPRDVYVGQSIKTTVYKNMGPTTSDFVCLKGKKGSSREYVYPIDKATEAYFTFTIQTGFQSGTYGFNIKRGDEIKYITDVVYNLTTEGSPDLPSGPELESGTTVYGLVSCDGTGIANVQVTDGYELAYTDSEGYYQLKSEKKNGYVYITVPSGYEVGSDGTQALFYDYLSRGKGIPERHDFSLYQAGDQTNHTIFFLGDMHLAGGKNSDRTQFATFTSELNSYVSSHSGEKMYAFTLGDMTWDLYWYERSYCFDEYVADMNAVKNLQVFNTIGNHDHDMRTSVDGKASGWDAVDWDTAKRFRKDLGPNYYSVNIGQVHYVVLDNIFCTNTTGGASGDRRYEEKVSDDNIAWLKKDLDNVTDKSTPIIVTMHAALYNQLGLNSLDNATALKNCFKDFSDVTFITGHTHKMWTIDNSTIKEHNSGAVCGSWWWAGRYNRTLNLAQDGAPSGYRVMDVKGKEMTSYFKGTGRADTYQFRTYDLNESYMPESEIPNAKDYGNYSKKQNSNEILINVWDYNTKWKVEVFENGKSLSVSRTTLYDPLYILAYVGQRYKTYTSSISFGPFMTNHMFKAKASSANSTLEIRVTDDEGRAYTETMTRPKAFNLDMYK